MKTGIQTSEFYLSLTTIIGLSLIALALILTNQTDRLTEVLQSLGLVLGGITASYTLGRSYVKGQVGGEAVPPGSKAGLE
jgi:hypothetical protein